jgi:Bacterial type II/III secretion system short domain/Domain of unknown function (DUF4177)
MRFRYLLGLTILTGLALGGWASAQPEQRAGRGGPQPRARWEYKVLDSNQVEGLAAKESQDRLTGGLNKLGADGWELVTVEPASSTLPVPTFVFKRPTVAGRRAEAEAPTAQPPAADQSAIRVYRLKNANASEVAQTLLRLLEPKAGSGLRLVGDDRTNSILAYGSPDQQAAVKTLIDELDTPVPAPEGPASEFRVYRLKYANAANLAQTLQKLLQVGEGKSLRLVSDENTNTLLTYGSARQQSEVEALIEQLDRQAGDRAEPKRK